MIHYVEYGILYGLKCGEFIFLTMYLFYLNIYIDNMFNKNKYINLYQTIIKDIRMKQKNNSEDNDFFCEYGGDIMEHIKGVTGYVSYILMCREHGIKPKPMAKNIRKFCQCLDKMSNVNGLETIESIANFPYIDKNQNHRCKK